MQVITLDGNESAPIPVECSVPEGFVLGSVQFISYSEDVVIVFNTHHHVQCDIFADDKQLSASAPVAEAHEAKKTVEQCVAAIKDWCASHRLKLNDGKTEVIWLGTRPRLQHLAGVDLNLSVGSDIIRPSTVVRDLGVFVDADLTFCEHVRLVTSSCFFQLHHLCQIRKHVNHQVMKQLVHAFVSSRLDYCNSILAGLIKGLISQLQRVLNSAARLVLGLQSRDHIKLALFELHWLPVHLRTLSTDAFCLCPVLSQLHQ